MEIIQEIKEVENYIYNGDTYDGYLIKTNKQEIFLGISNVRECCEEFGYFISDDSFDDYINSEFLKIELSDAALKSYEIINDNSQHRLVMFVNIYTIAGILQFTAYNEHGGYYTHSAIVISNQLNHEDIL